MKTKLLVLLVVISNVVSAQISQVPGYVSRNTKDHAVSGAWDSTAHIPAFNQIRLGNGSWPRAGAIGIDSLGGGKGFYWYIDQLWHRGIDSSELADSAASIRSAIIPGVGGGSLISIGAKFNIGVTGTSNTKSIQEGYNIKGDSTGSILTISARDTIYIIVTGQSNGVGHQFAGEIYQDTTGSAFVQGWNVTTDAWVRLQQAKAPMGSTSPGTQFTAPDDSSMNAAFYLAQALYKKTGKVVRVFQLSYGATAIDSWLPESSTIFARIKSELAAAGNPKIDFMIWSQGESDATMDDTAYHRRIDSLQAQLDRQTWFGQDIPMFMVMCTNTGVNFKINEIQRMLYSGKYDKRWKFIDGINLSVTSDNIHYTSYSQYQLAQKMFGYIFNEISMPNNYVNIDQLKLERIKLYAPRLYDSYLFNDSATGRKVFFNAPFVQTPDNSLANTLASTKTQISTLNVFTYNDSVFNSRVFAIQHRLNTDTLSSIRFMRGSSGSNTGFLSFYTSAAVLTRVADFTQDGKLLMYTNGIDVPNFTNLPTARFGGTYFGSNAATNNNFIGSNIVYASGFKLVNAGTGVLDYFDAAGPRVLQFAASGSAGAAATLTSVFMVKPDGSFGLGGTGMGTSLSVVTGAALQGTAAGNIGIGTSASAKLHVLSTTEQYRNGYDASNYLSITTSSTGSTTIVSTGTTPVLTIADSVKLTKIASTAIDTTQWKILVKNVGTNTVKTMAWAFAGSGGGGGSGTVTNVATGLGLTGGPITTTGTVAVDTAVGVGVVMWPRLNKRTDSLISLMSGGSGVAIGTTAITSGTVGHVLFQGTGNVVQQSSNLFWDNPNGRLGLRGATPQNTLDVGAGGVTIRDYANWTSGKGLGLGYYVAGDYALIRGFNGTGAAYTSIGIGVNDNQLFLPSTGSVGVNVSAPLNTLDVNGTLRVRTITNTSAVDSILVQDAGIVKYVDGSSFGGAVAGSTTQVIFNDAGAYAGDAGMVFNKTTDLLTIGAGTVSDLTPNSFVIAGTGGRLTSSSLTSTNLIAASGFNVSSTTSDANLDALAVVANSYSYSRNTNVVTFSVRFTVDPTASATVTTFHFMPALGSAFTSSAQATGTVTSGDVAAFSGSLVADAATDDMKVTFISPGTSSFVVTITGQYTVL